MFPQSSGPDPGADQAPAARLAVLTRGRLACLSWPRPPAVRNQALTQRPARAPREQQKAGSRGGAGDEMGDEGFEGSLDDLGEDP